MHTEMTMERIRTSVLALLFALAIWRPVSAQQHVADQIALDQVIAEVLEGAGLDLKRAETAVASLDDAEVGIIAAQARAVNDVLVGGQSKVTISTTVIIIGLLVLILLIVAI